jgi:hypothetical protein
MAAAPVAGGPLLLAGLAAEHVAALLPEPGEKRIRAGLLRLARPAIRPTEQ